MARVPTFTLGEIVSRVGSSVEWMIVDVRAETPYVLIARIVRPYGVPVEEAANASALVSIRRPLDAVPAARDLPPG